MAAKKDKGGIEALRMDVQSLADAFWKFRDAMLTDAAVVQAEQQGAVASHLAGEWSAPTDAGISQAASVLGALAQPQRLKIALMLEKGPTNVASIVDELGLKTTGSAYHHLNVLINNGIAVQPERGTFDFAPEARGTVGSVLVALFGSAESDDSTSKKKKKK